MPHLRGIQRPDKRNQSGTFDGLNVIQIDSGLVLQALFDTDRHLARCAAPRGCDGSHHDGVEKRNDFLPRKDQHRTSLVRGFEAVVPNLAAIYSGQEPSNSQPPKAIREGTVTVGPGVLFGDRTLASPPKILVGGAAENRRPAIASHLGVGVESRKQCFVEGDLYSLHVYNHTILRVLPGESRELYLWAMKIALIGLPQVGKKTLFSLMTGVPYDQLITRAGDYPVGMVKVTDPRIDKLSLCTSPRKRSTPRLNARSRRLRPKRRSPASNGSAS